MALGHVFPLDVRVDVPDTKRNPVPEIVIVEDNVTEPEEVIPNVMVMVLAYPVKSIVFPTRFDVFTVQAGEFAVKNTSSEDVGTVWPPAPPSVSDQFPVVLQLLSTPPATKYRLAIFHL
jgi:hypothetical protein